MPNPFPSFLFVFAWMIEFAAVFVIFIFSFILLLIFCLRDIIRYCHVTFLLYCIEKDGYFLVEVRNNCPYGKVKVRCTVFYKCGLQENLCHEKN